MRPTLLGLLRTAYVVVGALVSATLLPRLGVPATLVPDLVLIGVVATAVLRGPTHGAIVGLVSGWVVELVPPVGSPLGLTAVVMMVAGGLAGLLRSGSSRSRARAPLALLVGGGVVLVARVVSAVLAESPLDPAGALGRLASTLAVGLLVVPLWLAVDRALVRRRLG